MKDLKEHLFIGDFSTDNSVKKGEVISKNNIKIIRPSYGLEPKYFNKIIGRKFKKKLILGSRVKLSEIY